MLKHGVVKSGVPSPMLNGGLNVPEWRNRGEKLERADQSGARAAHATALTSLSRKLHAFWGEGSKE